MIEDLQSGTKLLSSLTEKQCKQAETSERLMGKYAKTLMLFRNRRMQSEAIKQANASSVQAVEQLSEASAGLASTLKGYRTKGDSRLVNS